MLAEGVNQLYGADRLAQSQQLCLTRAERALAVIDDLDPPYRLHSPQISMPLLER
jgi:hypothetical protein